MRPVLVAAAMVVTVRAAVVASAVVARPTAEFFSAAGAPQGKREQAREKAHENAPSRLSGLGQLG